ncbi:MAG TPA: hydrogenase nickel incorporation protein HypB [Vicinamibacterales bacterium]|nr:hydrogenase nickel incorporation protein HypB [Vicinamibacterales bacterium]
MCEYCGCGDPHRVSVDLRGEILAANDRQAAHNREHFAAHGVLAINLMGSPGSGKTAVLEATAAALGSRARIAAITGDLETERDAERLRAAGIPARAITTGSACHLDAGMIHEALHDEALHGASLLVIENVGNLVCPAVYDLGQDFNVVALAVTEGEDKPLKYPVMFRKADLVLVTKTDLLPHLGLSLELLDDAIARVMPAPAVFRVSARTGEGMDRWFAWLDAHLASRPGPDRAHAAFGHRHG